LKAVLNRQTSLMMILPTGGGKSLLFMMPVCLNNPRMIIMIVSFQILMNNLVKQLKISKIDCIK
jgi:superfamily II DNA helicase RecQ